VISALLQNRRPNLPQYSVCLECKQRTTVCVLVAQGIPCLGPVTQAGCGGICPSMGRGCYGCFGPLVQGNFDSLVPLLKSIERYPGETRRLLSHVSNYAPAFQTAVESLAEEEK
jgi:sulfhydrogenase subunit delta